MKRELTEAAVNLLRNRRQDLYSKGFSEARPAIVMSQLKPLWAEACKAHGVSPDDYPLPKWDMVARTIGHRLD